ncbi:hypothetical protein CCAX7_59190 [Capsulimonas corticalis]|uniref:Uncharacterized protein n=1 Tax=Capsulimonas corticalis TaxID=2219043 RepID=A0A402CZT0_9BACT|nr:J domain-containing protein [Capsulimonas corticalis]BDI33868.1 hypothetical protein CCAX7_59190 [Capsulimonas corticalis]
MSSMPDRLYKVAKAYLDAARGRLEDIDAAAQEELRRALPRENTDYGRSIPAASDDPMERAAAKIAAARNAAAARREITPERYNFSTPSEDETPAAPKTASLVENAYKIIGVPLGSAFPTVEKAVVKLRERCAPDKFPAGSPEQAEARRILSRIEDAYRILQDALGVQQGRFDRLEL